MPRGLSQYEMHLYLQKKHGFKLQVENTLSCHRCQLRASSKDKTGSETLRFWRRRGKWALCRVCWPAGFLAFCISSWGGSLRLLRATKSSFKCADQDPALRDLRSWGLGGIPERMARVGGSVTFSRVFAAKTNAPL